MAEYSFPVLEQPLSDQQWGQIVESFGSGIMARRSEPYGIPNGGIDNAANTVKIGGRSPVTGDGRAVVSGFFHRYDADVTLSVPAVTATTTYHLGLTYDPTKHAEPGGPVSLTVTTAQPAGSGKVYLPVYTLTRRANELLSDATIVDQRAFIAPTITVKGSKALPPGDGLLSYTVATDWETGQQWQLNRQGAWAPTGARTVATTSPSLWSQTGGPVVVQPLADGRDEYRLEVELRRTGPAFTLGSSYLTLADSFLPSALRGPRGIVYSYANISGAAGEAALNTTTGQLSIRRQSGTTTFGTGSRIAFSAIWVA